MSGSMDQQNLDLHISETIYIANDVVEAGAVTALLEEANIDYALRPAGIQNALAMGPLGMGPTHILVGRGDLVRAEHVLKEGLMNESGDS